jgi:hypothetical protein
MMRSVMCVIYDRHREPLRVPRSQLTFLAAAERVDPMS